jgi:DNA-binding response OmpR family regulator
MPKKILVADDSVVIQKSIGITFAQEDFQVTFVGNGEEAFQRSKELKPDLILADTSMPKLAGAELCKKFRQEAEFRRTPIILLASAQENFNPGQLKACGANDFIQKPFESSVLIEKVKTQLSGATDAGAAVKTAAMESSIDHAFGNTPVTAEEETAITSLPPSKPIEIAFEQSEELSMDMTAAAYDSVTPTQSSVTSLDVLSIEDSEEHAPGQFVPYEEEKTKAEPSDPKLREQAAPARPAPTPAPAAFELSEDQIEKIVSKVFQNVIERIAWEVVPEMAERIIKDEIKKITDDPK